MTSAAPDSSNQAEPPAHKTIELDLPIYTFDIDFAGHVSNITYIRWLEIGRLRLLEEVGLPVPRLMSEGQAPLLVRTEIDYRLPLRLGEPVHMSLCLVELRAASATMEFQFTTDGRVAATARQVGLFVSSETGKPSRISPELRQRFVPYMRGD